MAAQVRSKKVINVCFSLWSPAQFKAASLFTLMQEHPRFNPVISIFPNMGYNEEEERLSVMKAAQQHFKAKGFPVLEESDIEEIRRSFHPDIIFESAPYESTLSALFGTIKPELRCYIPYCFRNTDSWISYNQVKQNRMWFNFVESPYYLDLARNTMCNKGANAICTGYPFVDKYFHRDRFPSSDEPKWQLSNGKLKRIIWAPHWAIHYGSLLQAGSFPEFAEDMLTLAKEYADKIQFVFKPHPKLREMLLKHPDWGKERTEAYYQAWADLPNAQYENGDYTNLFLDSDGMIHDCGSFIIEYMLTGHPCCFLHRQETMPHFNQITNDALEAHYHAETVQEIRAFFDDIILSEQDPKKEKRDNFVSQYLQPPHGQSAAQNIIDAILGIEKETISTAEDKR